MIDAQEIPKQARVDAVSVLRALDGNGAMRVGALERETGLGRARMKRALAALAALEHVEEISPGTWRYVEGRSANGSGDGRYEHVWLDRMTRPIPVPGACPPHVWEQIPARGRPRADRKEVRAFRCSLCGETRRDVLA